MTVLPKVSVIIPTYKRPELLSRAIDSVINQKYKNCEIIVVDDNNPSSSFREETEKVMKNYDNMNNVKYIKHEKNMNGSVARNTGISESSGNYIAFLDDDDEFLPDKIFNQVNTMQSLDETWGACYTSYEKINENSSKQYSDEKREGNLLIEALMRTLYIQAGSNLLVRKNVVDELNGFDETFKRNQDLEFLVRLLERYKLAYVDSCSLIIHYEVRDSKKTYYELKEIDSYYLKSFKNIIDKLSENNKRKVYTMIALDNFRRSIGYREIIDGLKTLKENQVSFLQTIKFVLYLAHRVLTKKSYGFEIK